MNVICVGELFPYHLLQEIDRLGSYVDYASYTFQTALVAGLDYWYPDMRVLSSMRVDSYPKVNRIVFNPELYSHNNKEEKQDIFIGFINLPFIKRISKFIRLRSNLKSMLKEDNQNIVIMYSVNSPNVLALATLRHRVKRSCLIVPDLPEYMSDNKSLYYRLAKRIDRFFIDWAIKRIDSFALLSPHMAEKLPLKGKEWRQLEGIFHEERESLSEPMVHNNRDLKAILYTGVLGERYGIIDLLNAFSKIKAPNYRLWIRGNGECKDVVLQRAKIDSRIVYYNAMSKPELLRLQSAATILVNPVKGSQEFTRYFFPSKTMEYLASGTPVLMYHLPCIPKEYDDYLHYFENETEEEMVNKITWLCEQSDEERNTFGEKASFFVRTKKNEVSQTHIIVDLLKTELE